MANIRSKWRAYVQMRLLAVPVLGLALHGAAHGAAASGSGDPDSTAPGRPVVTAPGRPPAAAAAAEAEAAVGEVPEAALTKMAWPCRVRSWPAG